MTQTSEVLAVSTARPPTNMDRSVTEVGVAAPWLQFDCPRHEADVCLQPVPVSTDSVTTVLAQTGAVNRTPVCRASPGRFVTVKRWPAASRLTSVMLMPTVTSARQPSGESSCSATSVVVVLLLTLAQMCRLLPAGGTVAHTPQLVAPSSRCVLFLGASVNLVTRVMALPVWSPTLVPPLTEAAAV